MKIILSYDSNRNKGRVISSSFAEIRQALSCEDKSLFFMHLKRGRRLQAIPRRYLLNDRGYFEVRLTQTLIEELRVRFPQSEITVSPELTEKCNPKRLSNEAVFLNLTPFYYQQEAVEVALTKGYGCIVLPTSAGKTLIIAMLAETAAQNGHRVFILVPNIQLVEQTAMDLISYGIKSSICKWSGKNEYDPNAQIVVANSQILVSPTVNAFSILSTFSCFIIDECHKLATSDKVFKAVSPHLRQVSHVFGLTASLPVEKFNRWKLWGLVGPVIYSKRSDELRKKQHISPVKIVAFQLQHENVPHFAHPTLDDPTIAYHEEIEYLINEPFRNKIIVELTKLLNKNTLILVDRIAHGELLSNLLKQNLSSDRNVHFVHGKVEVENREKIRSLMESQDGGVVCIAISSIFSTGISIKNLHYVIFAAIGKAKIRIIQSIGRSLRLHSSKKQAVIFDIADVKFPYSQKHYLERLNIYKEEGIPLVTTSITQRLTKPLLAL